MGRVQHVQGSLASLLARAQIHNRRPEIGALTHAHRGVPNQASRAPQTRHELRGGEVSGEHDPISVEVFVFAELLRRVVAPSVLSRPEPQHLPRRRERQDGFKGLLNLLTGVVGFVGHGMLQDDNRPIVERVGEGASGEVYRGTSVGVDEPLDTHRLKVLRRFVGGGEVVVCEG